MENGNNCLYQIAERRFGFQYTEMKAGYMDSIVIISVQGGKPETVLK
jgi:hypothetical protein